MRILFLTCHLPFPPLSGGRRREYELIRRVSLEHEIVLCCITKTYQDDVAHVRDALEWCSDVLLFEANHSAEFAGAGGLKAASWQMRRHSSAAAQKAIASHLIEDVDFVHVEGYYLLNNLPDDAAQPIVLVDQNVEYLLLRQRAEVVAAGERRAHQVEYLRTKHWERLAWEQASMAVLVTEDDCRHVARHARVPVRCVSNGFDHDPVLNVPNTGAPVAGDAPTMLFVGNFGYSPNIDAACHLVSDVLPQVLKTVPTARLLLVGNAPPPAVVELGRHPAVTVTGPVPALRPFLDAADVFVCPLRIGGGIKVKVLEALAAGATVVTTSIGTQGLSSGVERVARVHDDAGAFAAAVINVLLDPMNAQERTRAVRAFASRLPTWDDAAAELSACYREAVLASDRGVETTSAYSN